MAGSNLRCGFKAVENEWFAAGFPSKVEIAHDDSDRLAKVTEYTAETQPFGIFSIRVTNMAIDVFIAVGATKWITDTGDNLVKRFADRKAVVVQDNHRDPAPGLKVRDLSIRFDYEGACGCFGRVMAITDGKQGRILEATAIVDWSPQWEERALAFLDSVRLTVPQPSWKPEV